MTTASAAPILDAPPEAPKPETPAVAAVEPQATPDLEASAAEPLIPEPDTTASIAAPDQGIDPPRQPSADSPVRQAQGREARAKAAAKVARKKRVRTAQRAAPANNPLGNNPASNPFGYPAAVTAAPAAVASWQKRQRHANCVP